MKLQETVNMRDVTALARYSATLRNTQKLTYKKSCSQMWQEIMTEGVKLLFLDTVIRLQVR
jgi:hypothetical protein